VLGVIRQGGVRREHSELPWRTDPSIGGRLTAGEQVHGRSNNRSDVLGVIGWGGPIWGGARWEGTQMGGTQ